MIKKDLKIELDKVYNYLFLLLTQTVDNSILARGLFLLENLIQNYPKVEIAKTSNLDTLVTICNQNINNVDIVKSFLSITLVISSSLLTSLLFFIIIPLILIVIITFIKQKEKKAFNNSCFLKISFA